jgi:hypothetical protein
MVWVLINHDFIAIPKPIPAEAYIVGSNGEEEAAKPEAARTAALKSEDVAGAKPASEMAVLPGVLQVIVRVITASFMSNPLAVVVNVRRFRVSGLVIEYLSR